jgi:hypothetical protein
MLSLLPRLSAAWCPRLSGGAIGFDIERVAGQSFHSSPSRTSSSPMPIVTIGASPAAPSYRLHRSPVAGLGAGAHVSQEQTKLSAAPLRGRSAASCPRRSTSDAGTASQLIPGVRPTWRVQS